MARPREFDEDMVLDRALEAFWAKGFEGTSIEDLVQATGLGRASLYGAFGDKEALFQRVVEHYQQRLGEPARLLEDAGSARKALEILMRSWVGSTCPRKGQRGCFLIMAGSSGDGPAFARDALASSLTKLEKTLAELIRAGQASGELAKGRDPTAVARLLVTLVQGIATSARAGWGTDRLNDVVEEALGYVTAGCP